MGREMIFYVYSYTEPGEEDPFYIGKGHNDRAYAHLRRKFRQAKTRFYCKLNSLRVQGIQPQIDYLGKDMFEIEAFALEEYLIKYYGRLDLGTGCLTNHTDGGDGVKGLLCSIDTRKKISEANKGNVAWNKGIKSGELSFDTRYKMSLAKVGVEKSFQTRERISNAQVNRSETINQLISKAHTEKFGLGVCAIDMMTLQVVISFPSIQSTKEKGFDPGNIANVLNKKLKSHKGYYWAYTNHLKALGIKEPT